MTWVLLYLEQFYCKYLFFLPLNPALAMTNWSKYGNWLKSQSLSKESIKIVIGKSWGQTREIHHDILYRWATHSFTFSNSIEWCWLSGKKSISVHATKAIYFSSFCADISIQNPLSHARLCIKCWFSLMVCAGHTVVINQDECWRIILSKMMTVFQSPKKKETRKPWPFAPASLFHSLD